MKRGLLLVFTCLFFVLGCSSDDKEHGYDNTDELITVDKLIGKWELVDVKWDSGEAFFEDKCRKEFKTFNSNKKVIADIKYGQKNQCHNTSIVEEWSLHYDKVKYYNPKTKKYREDKIYKLTNKELIVLTDIESEFMLIVDIYNPSDPVFISQVIKTYRRK